MASHKHDKMADQFGYLISYSAIHYMYTSCLIVAI